MQGIQLGAAEFLERPLSFQKLRTLWQHKIRKVGRLCRAARCALLGGRRVGTTLDMRLLRHALLAAL
jgi:hypothetical protein